ncbi:MAG: UDP-N-acetylmuramoyl-tripeptide--D-alanyl-D-alanine ligase [candidate division KSB1 bacterium]|nr:UDP-N-acetylmuramoyl-tripeptide--D-alanyl-D-alanine ligase [candidate division KSB1 bacterium]MDQ7063916.1 UDP-N-acetylmuramoyl-tripeptide--D-alanyl-D-alanine ligase [candidate division KSB1 bacterium]
MSNKMNWSLQEVIDALPLRHRQIASGQVLAEAPAGVCIDSRQLQPGDVFVAIRGERHDGHAFVNDVFQKQALAAIVNEAWWQANHDRYIGRTILVVEDTLAALQTLANGYRRRIDPQVIGLTGTNGKTTTKELLARVLAQRYRVHKTAGNLNNHIGVPLTLLAMPADTEVAVVEMGTNHFGEIAALCNIAEPDYGLITNIGRGHTEFLYDLEGVRKAKQELFEFLADSGLAFVNADDPMVIKAAHAAGVRQRVTYGFEHEADVRGTDLQLDSRGNAHFKVDRREFIVGVPGLHNASNALAAVTLGRYFRVPEEDMVDALAQPVSEVSGRMRVWTLAGRTIIDDSYNANPESMRAALEFLQKIPASGRKFAVLGDMFELGDLRLQGHQEVLQTAASLGIHFVWATGEAMAEAFQEEGWHRHPGFRWFASRDELAAELINTSGSGDVLLIKGSRGMRMEELIQAMQSHFETDPSRQNREAGNQ